MIMGNPFGFGFDMMFTIVPVIIVIGFVTVAVKGITQWNKNNNSPLLTVTAGVVTKRTKVSRHHHDNGAQGGMHTTSSTSYYVTFEVESGDRIELLVDSTEYGMLVEGDVGKLTFQGSRYKGFDRKKEVL